MSSSAAENRSVQITFANAELALAGHIQAENAAAVYAQGLGYVLQHAQTGQMRVNLAGLQHGNTLALAVLLQWLRQTPNAQGLCFSHVPTKMLKIIQACNLQDTLQLQTI